METSRISIGNKTVLSMSIGNKTIQNTSAILGAFVNAALSTNIEQNGPNDLQEDNQFEN